MRLRNTRIQWELPCSVTRKDKVINTLIETFKNYCFSRFSGSKVGALAQELADSKQVLEADALIYTFKKKGKSKVWKTLSASDLTDRPEFQSWAGARVWVGPELPRDAENGDWWFDPLEINFYVYANRQPLNEFDAVFPGWCAITPCRVWQYRACVQMANFEPDTRPQSMLWVKDLFEDRFQHRNNSEYITDIYAEEALMYSRFWGRTTTSNFGNIARSYIPERARSLFAHHLFLLGGHPGREELRRLYDSSLLFERDAETWPYHFKMLENFRKFIDIEEWERHPDGGFQCYIDTRGGKQFTYRKELPLQLNYGWFHNEIFNLNPESDNS